MTQTSFAQEHLPEEHHWDCIVIGGSAAGLSAALTLGRARRKVLVVDQQLPRNRFADHMHGVLGHEGVAPAELVRRGQEEAASYGAKFLFSTVAEVTESSSADLRSLRVMLQDGRTIFTRSVISASGLTDQLPQVPGLAERWGKTVLHCPYCHGWEVRDGHLGVIANGPLSTHVAQLIRQWSPNITFFSAGAGELTEEMHQRLQARGVVVEPTPVLQVNGEGTNISDVELQDGRRVPVDALFAVGSASPHDTYLSALALDRTDTPMGSFLAVDPTFRTSHPRIWAAGNVANPGANVPLSISSGNFAAAAVNAALVEEDFDRAVRQAEETPARV